MFSTPLEMMMHPVLLACLMSFRFLRDWFFPPPNAKNNDVSASIFGELFYRATMTRVAKTTSPTAKMFVAGGLPPPQSKKATNEKEA